MAKTTDLAEVTTLADGDLGNAVDVSNVSMDATGTNSKFTMANLWAYIKTKADTFYQTILVSGTSIKTVNGTTLLGAGDLVTPQGDVTAVSVATANGVSGSSSGGATPALTLALGDITPTSVVASKAGLPARFTNTTDSSSVQVLRLDGDRATNADADEAYMSIYLSDDGGNQTEIGRITAVGVDINAGTNIDGGLQFSYAVTGTMQKRIRMDSNFFYPFSNDLMALGAGTVSWSDLFLASGGVINWNNGNVTLTHSAGLLTLSSPLSLGTSNALTAGTVELGHASDTTLTRVSAGVVAVEGNNLMRANDNATASDINTGTSTTKFNTPDALAGSYAGTKSISIQCFDGGTDVTTGDGKAYITIPEALNGMNLVRAQATVVTAGTTNATTIMIHNKTQAADMLSGAISIASAGTVGTVGTVDGANDDVATNDVLRIDVDSVSTTAPKGLMVVLEFRLP